MTVNLLSGKISMFPSFPLGIVRSVRIVLKRCCHSTFRSKENIRCKCISSSFVPQQKCGVICVLITRNANERIGLLFAEIFTIHVAYFVVFFQT